MNNITTRIKEVSTIEQQGNEKSHHSVRGFLVMSPYYGILAQFAQRSSHILNNCSRPGVRGGNMNAKNAFFGNGESNALLKARIEEMGDETFVDQYGYHMLFVFLVGLYLGFHLLRIQNPRRF